MSCSPDPNENFAKAEWKIREAAGRGAQIVCTEELFRSQYFCRSEDHAMFALAESIPGPSTDSLGALARELGIVIIASLFERRAAGVYHNTAAILNVNGEIAGHVSQDAHPRRSALLRKILFHARRSGLPQFRYALRPRRRAGVLGPVVSGRRAAFLAGRREHSVLSHGHRLASQRESRAWRGAARCVADHPALARHRQRDLRRRRESRRL